MEKGCLKTIWIKRATRGPMDSVPQASLVEGRGLVGNANQGGKRQVTIIEEEIWRLMMSELEANVPPSARRANLMVVGVALAETRGRILRVGSCRIRILGETKPCERMDEAFAGLRKTMSPHWRGGAFGEVIGAGDIAVGDEVCWDDSTH